MTVEDFRYGLSLNDLFYEHLLAIDDDNTLVAVVNLLTREVVANGVLDCAVFDGLNCSIIAL